MKQIFALCAIVLTLASCKKSDSNNSSNGYYIKCTIDGVARTFNVQNIAARQQQGSYTALNIGGYAASNSQETFGFIIINQPSAKAITAGTYVATTTDFEILANYSLSDNGPDYEAGTTVQQEAVYSNVTVAKPLTVVITSLTNDNVKGSFSGDFYLNGDPTGAKKTVSNGEFNLKIYQ